MKWPVIHLLLVASLIVACNSSSQEDKTTLTISAAASLSDSLMKVKKEFEKENHTIELVFNFGGTGTLRRQIEQGAPIDVFIAAAKSDYEMLAKDDVLDRGTSFLTNQLVLIKAPEVKGESLEDFIDTNSPLAIGTPEFVPAGMYAKQSLEQLEVWDELSDQLVFAKDVKHVLTLVKDQAVDIGFVYYSDTIGEQGVEIIEEMNPNLHTSIDYYVATVAASNYQKETDIFYNFIKSNEGLDIFKSYGFQIR
ncbi:molybdate ABC transporter substrate-binding protein [Aquibacillus albus]|uniref:Molybdate transport system substrate-binding protein n=1 Tax=Aquibacillus albus TaxID=1168171 RepID=A0ABS2MYS9_9BACI|nr:molybdate ABC transporter substrate-binding protein [Aquibacillus albus]MBM7570948.1 molybdate transport system substrate-binding protein [Aquibacillus albus]